MPPFSYTPFNGAPYVASVGELLARQNEAAARAAEITASAQARAAEVRGHVWGQAFNAIGEIPQQIAQLQDAAQLRKLREQELASRTIDLQDRVQQHQLAAAQRTAGLLGTLAVRSTNAEDFGTGLTGLIAQGVLPKEAAQHFQDDLAHAGGDFGVTRQRYIDTADAFQQPIKLGADDSIIRPSIDPTRPAATIATGKGKGFNLRPGEQHFEEPTPGQPPVATASVPPPAGQGGYTINGQRFAADGTPIGAAVPLQEKPGEAEERQARIKQIGAETTKIQQQIEGTTPLSTKDKAELAIQRDRLNLERTGLEIRERREDPASPQNQEKLEQAYRTLAQSVIRSRNGQLGVEDTKIGTAKHLLALLEQARTPEGTFDLARIQRRELAEGLARLISPNGQVSEGRIEELDQRTAKGSLADLLTYVTGNPKLVNATPQKIADLFYDSIVRQGRQAEQNREKELDFIRASRPTDLTPQRAVGIEAGLAGLNHIDDSLPGGRDYSGHSTSGFSVVAPDGRTYTFPSQSKLDAFKKEAGIQ